MGKVMHISFGKNEFIYNKKLGMYQTERYIPGILPNDKISVETFDYIYTINAKSYRDKIVFFTQMKPDRDIRMRISIERGRKV